MTKKDTFICFLAALQKRVSEQLIPALVFQRLISLMCESVKQEHLVNIEEGMTCDSTENAGTGKNSPRFKDNSISEKEK